MRVVWATKGLEAETGRLLQDVAREALGDAIPLAVISGPTFAKELAAGLPTAISLASTDPAFADDLQQLLHCGKSFRVYSNPDFIGVQLGGAVKNVIAIGAGMSDGIGFGANARTALITRGLTEMSAWRGAGRRSGHLYGDGGPGRSGADLYRQPVA
jgi:glycerol-3-phosphate dehydrogenase (NAD(P)+)